MAEDGETWTDLAVEMDDRGGDWNQLLYSSQALPSNARQLRILWQNLEGRTWSPQRVDAERVLIEAYRRMSSAEKLQRVVSVTQGVRQMALARLRLQQQTTVSVSFSSGSPSQSLASPGRPRSIRTWVGRGWLAGSVVPGWGRGRLAGSVLDGFPDGSPGVGQASASSVSVRSLQSLSMPSPHSSWTPGLTAAFLSSQSTQAS